MYSETSAVCPPMSAEPFIVPYCERPVTVLFADAALIAVDKPHGLLSVPGRDPANRDCVPARLLAEYGPLRIVHRLDLDTSGVMVLARSADAHRHLNRQFEQRTVAKYYEALVWGLPERDAGEIDLPLCVDWPNRPKKKVDYVDGKQALTRYRVLARDAAANCARLELAPVTGRSHQLRVHLAAIGHPILGCPFYAHPAARAAAARLTLHARRLELTHPLSGEALVFTVPTPF
jgi:tRNA pseudouridine32 synthase/23S rRNA pseudouridine746 synthase